LLTLRIARTPLTIDLLEWREPRDAEPPYPHLDHLGLARIALASDAFDAGISTDSGIAL